MTPGDVDSEAALAAILQASEDAIVTHELDGTITSWNAAAERLLGHSEAEALGKSIALIVPADLEESHALNRARLGHVVRGETVLRRKDGTRVAVWLTNVPLRNPSGEVVGASSIARAVTDRPRTDRDALRLAAIVESSDDAIISKDLQGVIQTWNRAAERMFGYTAAEVIGRPITIIIPPERLDEEKTVLDRVRSGRSIDHFETVRLHKDGHQLEISLTVSPIRTADGVIIGASKIARDITERNRLWRQLQLAYRLKDEFLATLSHELRTPLNAILGYARMLRGPVLEGDRREHALEIVEKNADVLVRLVSDLLDMSRIVLGKVRLDFHSCDVERIAEAAIESLRPTCDAKGVHLESDIDSRAGRVSGDRDRLQQVFWNLLSNAVKFTPAGGTVRARLARTGSHLEFVVEDTGRGIPPEFLPHLFERFSQADHGPTRGFGGLGVGLALVRHFVELHGGSVDATSEGLDKGARFKIRLPVIPVARKRAANANGRRHATSASASMDDGQQLAGVTVLAVDDEPEALRLVNDVLESAGASVLCASSAQIALGVLDTEQPNVIVADLGMPRMDGYEFIARLRSRPASRGGGIPAAVLTTYDRTEDRTRSLLAGFQMHLAKPIDPPQLIAAVAALALARPSSSK